MVECPLEVPSLTLRMVPSEVLCIVPSDTPSVCELVLPDIELTDPKPEMVLPWLYPAETPLSNPPTMGILPNTDFPKSTLTPKPLLSDQPPPDELPCEDMLPCESEVIVLCEVPSETLWLVPSEVD
jgi:hypothetical protein